MVLYSVQDAGIQLLVIWLMLSALNAGTGFVQTAMNRSYFEYGKQQPAYSEK